VASGVLRLAAVAAALVAAGPAAAAPPRSSDAWQKYVVSGDRPPDFRATTIPAGGRLDVDFGHEVAGNLELKLGAVSPGALARVSFSETGYYLRDTTDWPRAHATDDHQPTSGETWVDVPGCQVSGICGDGYHAFRYVRIRAEGGAIAIDAVSVRLPPSVRAPQGWFLSSDELLNRIWYSSLYTAQLMVMPNDPATLDERGCRIDAYQGRPIVIDGAKRDRCPWIGDQSVSQLALLLAGGNEEALHNTLDLFAAAQHEDGLIPASPSQDYAVWLLDYPAYWALAVRNLMLYRGTEAVGPWWPTLQRLLDGWLPRQLDARGLVQDTFGHADYAFIRRRGDEIAYFNGLYAVALRAGAQVAGALGHPAQASGWTARANALAVATATVFWDPAAGAFRDTTTGPTVHPQDGNAFAVLAGGATAAQARSAFAYLDRTTARPWGNAIADNNVWDDPNWGYGASGRVYPFIAYYDAVARFESNSDDSALSVLRRTWGWMVDPLHDSPGTAWEAIGPYGSIDGYQKQFTSMASGWSTGAAPALTSYVLGLRPTSAGYATFDALPHPGDLAWAQGAVPTPAGLVRFSWRRDGARWRLRLEPPAALRARVGAPAPARAKVTIDGRAARAQAEDGYVFVSLAGDHTVTVG
jgi:hypothetical protein